MAIPADQYIAGEFLTAIAATTEPLVWIKTLVVADTLIGFHDSTGDPAANQRTLRLAQTPGCASLFGAPL